MKTVDLWPPVYPRAEGSDLCDSADNRTHNTMLRHHPTDEKRVQVVNLQDRDIDSIRSAATGPVDG